MIPVGASLVLNPVDSWNIIWGNATRVYNFFNKVGLQPAAVVYMANCSVVGGESAGWKTSLRSFAVIRGNEGMDFEEFHIGYPGAQVVSELVGTEYGPRWLGILATVSTVRDEPGAARGLLHFLRDVASTSTATFDLSLEQCEKMWTVAREIFFDTPYWYEFLRITSQCAQVAEFNVLEHIFPPGRLTDTFVASFMTTALRIWELANDQQALGRRIYARGSSGAAQLIFYLSLVCGFHVVLYTASRGDIDFGTKEGPVHVVIELRDNRSETWHTGYLIEGSSIDRVVADTLADGSKTDLWRPGRAMYAPQYHSDYKINVSDTSRSGGAVFLTMAESIREEVEGTGLETHVSAWMAQLLHHMSYRLIVRVDLERSEESFRRGNKRVRTQKQRNALSERLGVAVELLCPGIIAPSHLKQLLMDVRGDVEPEALPRLQDRVRKDKGAELCACEMHGGGEQMVCKFEEMGRELKEIAHRVWVGSYVDVNSQYLRDIGPDYLFNLKDGIFDLKEGSKEQIILASVLLSQIAGWLAGRQVLASYTSVVGLVAGGFVVGFRGNEHQDIAHDTGHCAYICVGSINAKDRRVDELAEDQRGRMEMETLLPANLDEALSTDGIIHSSRDYYGRSELRIETDTEKNVGFFRAFALTPRGKCNFKVMAALDSASAVSLFSSCLGKCVSGSLTDKELNAVQVISGQNASGDGLWGRKKLALLAAHGDTLLQRTFLARWRPNRVMLLAGKCVPCAVRSALIEQFDLLLC